MSRPFDYKRADRVSELLKSEISQIVRRDVKDPAVGEVTITRVQMTDDIKMATVSFGVLDRTEEAEQMTESLQRAAGHIQRVLGKRLRLRFIPKLTFQFDRNLDYSLKISKLLEEIDEEDS